MRATGRMLANFAFLFALAVWGGAVVFFTFITTPIVFADLDRDLAAGLLGHLFPRFFQVQVICSAIALAFIAARLFFGAPPRKLTIAAGIMLTVALAIALYNNFVLLPDMTAAQAHVTSFVTTTKDDPARVAYGRLHGRAMILNGLAALLGGATLALAAFDPRLLTRRDERATAAQGVDIPGASGHATRGQTIPTR
ncbi:MAG TPA: DUF4149 domain-containing protein [Thermomicrobiales bacterium]|jgi:hypothetical protein